MKLSNRWIFNTLIFWSVPWCWAAAVKTARSISQIVHVPPEETNTIIGAVIIATIATVLTNFKFNSFSRYSTVVLLVIYKIFSIAHIVNMIKAGNYIQESKIPLAPLVVIVNLFVIYYFLGKPYRDLYESYKKEQRPGWER